MTAAKRSAPDHQTDTGRAGITAPIFTAPNFTGVDPNMMGAAYGQTMLELQREWLVGMGQMQRDYLSFLGERMRKDIEIARRIAECRDVQAALELQSAFVETAREDYMEEAQKVLAKSRELTEHCVECLADMPHQTNGNGKHRAD
jgi:hypothetical protein